MAEYYRGAGTWREYLQNQSYVDDITYEIARSSREQVASIEALNRDNVRVATGVARAVERVEVAVQSVNRSIQHLDSTFRWGFSTLIALVGSLGESIEELIRIAKIPNRIKAYEYYDDSREAYCRRHYREAESAIDKALNGDQQSTTGYRLDWRLYHQKSILCLGGAGELSEFVNIEDAAAAAATAVGLAVSAGDHRGASVAALTASFAEYCRQQYDDALTWALKAVQFDGEHAAAAFQAAKVLMAKQQPVQAIDYLFAAVMLDRRYLLRVLDETEGDFTPHQPFVLGKLQELRSRLATDLSEDFRVLLADSAVWGSLLSDEAQLQSWLPLVEPLASSPCPTQLYDLLQIREWRVSRIKAPEGNPWTVDLMLRAQRIAGTLPAILAFLEQLVVVRDAFAQEAATVLKGSLADAAFWTPLLESSQPAVICRYIDSVLTTPTMLQLCEVVRLSAWLTAQQSAGTGRAVSWSPALLARASGAAVGLSGVRPFLTRVADLGADNEKASMRSAWKTAGLIAAATGGSLVAGLVCQSFANPRDSSGCLTQIGMGVGALGVIVFAFGFWVGLVVSALLILVAVGATVASLSKAQRWSDAIS